VPSIVDAVRRMGMQIDDQERRLAQSAGAAVMITTYALALLSLLICLLAAVNIAHALFASVSARAREIGIMQTVGATRRDIRNLILTEAGVIGIFGGVVGTAAAALVAAAVGRFSPPPAPHFPFKTVTLLSPARRSLSPGPAARVPGAPCPT